VGVGRRGKRRRGKGGGGMEAKFKRATSRWHGGNSAADTLRPGWPGGGRLKGVERGIGEGWRRGGGGGGEGREAAGGRAARMQIFAATEIETIRQLESSTRTGLCRFAPPAR